MHLCQAPNLSNATMQEKMLAKLFLWNTILMLVGVFIIELTFGSWFSSNELNNLNILRNRVWHYDFNYPGITENERKIVYSRDRWGLRGDYGAPEDITILTIGGSTTDQRYISDSGTWQEVMMQEFAKIGQSIGIANAGVDGRTSFAHLHDFNLWFPKIKKLKPKFVILYVGINDMYFTQPHPLFDQPYSKPTTLTARLKRNSIVYSLLQTLVGTYRVETRNIGHSAIDYPNAIWTDTPKQSIEKAQIDTRLTLYSEQFGRLLEASTNMGATPIVVTQPRGDSRVIDGQLHGIDHSKSDDTTNINDHVLGALNKDTANGLDYHQILSHFNDASLAQCEDAGGICIDLANELHFGDNDFYDCIHNTRAGAKKIGEFLYIKLKGLIQ